MSTLYQFDPVDKEMVRVVAKIPPGRRIQRLLAGRALAVGLKRGRIRAQRPDLSDREINLMILKEIERGNRPIPDF